MQKKFVVIIPSYNNQKWCTYNLDSVYRQNYKNFRVIYINDCSTDQTATLVQNYARIHTLNNFIFINNQNRRGALANIWHAINLCKNNEIIVTLDGDDWFAHDHVLAYLNHVYQNSNTWLTYGQFQNWPTGTHGWCKKIPEHVIRNNSFRDFGFWFAQLRTFYAWLAKKVHSTDLLDPHTHNFFRVAGDAALMFPMVEMAGTHSIFIPNILYIRNVATPINDFKVHLHKQLNTTAYLKMLPAYTPIPLAKNRAPVTLKV